MQRSTLRARAAFYLAFAATIRRGIEVRGYANETHLAEFRNALYWAKLVRTNPGYAKLP